MFIHTTVSKWWKYFHVIFIDFRIKIAFLLSFLVMSWDVTQIQIIIAIMLFLLWFLYPLLWVREKWRTVPPVFVHICPTHLISDATCFVCLDFLAVFVSWVSGQISIELLKHKNSLKLKSVLHNFTWNWALDLEVKFVGTLHGLSQLWLRVR